MSEQPWSKESRIFFLFVMIFSLVISYYLLQPYLATAVFAIVVVVMFKPVYDWLYRICKQREMLATTLAILVVILTLLIPLSLVVNITIDQAFQFRDELSRLVSGDNVSLAIIVEKLNEVLKALPFLKNETLTEAALIQKIQEIVQPVVGFLADKAVRVGSSSTAWVTKIIVFIAVLGALFPRYTDFITLIKDLSPLDDELDQYFIDRMIAMTRSMVRGVFIIAIVQGSLAGLLYWIAGVKFVAFWTLLAIFLSILPMGAHVISIPIGITLFLIGDLWQSALVIGGSLVFVANIDNFLRPRLVSKESEMSTALVLLSAFGGLNLFGFLGVIYGPVIMIFVVTSIEVYRSRYLQLPEKTEKKMSDDKELYPLQYPIGEYSPPARISPEQIEEWIGVLEEAPGRLRQAVAGLSPEQLQTPYRPGGWTVQQLVHHLADSHMNSYIRFKLALSEDQPTIRPYDQDAWAELYDALHGPVSLSLDLLEALHQRWTFLLRHLTEGQWQRRYHHPESGESPTLAETLGLYAWHSQHHLAHITGLKERMGW